MYNFIDTNEVSEGAFLPSEALQINGEYIENMINGYKTLNVSGREALSPEIEYFETGVRDGSTMQSRRYPARTIIVTYQLVAESNEAFREAYNKLGGILNVENAELIFNDEPDKFFTGTPSSIGEVPPGKNSIVGEIEFFCADPFKYSIVEYEAEPALDESSILIDYNGTYKAFPTLQADFFKEEDVSEDGGTAGTLTGNGDCGFVAFFNEDEKIIQLGDPDEADIVHQDKSQTLVNQTFQSSTAWGATAQDLWDTNLGTVLPSSVKQLGSVGMKPASWTAPSSASTSGTLLKSAKSTQSAPTFYYTVTAKTSERTATSVKVSIAITASLGASGSYFGRGLGLTGSVYIGGAWHNVTIKPTSAYWKGKSGHTVNMAVTVTGLTEASTSITGIKFKVTRIDTSGNAGKLGETSCSNLAISTYAASVPASYFMTAATYGAASGAYHGPSITRTISADKAGEVGATDFTFTYKHKMCIGNGNNDTRQLGGFQVQLSDANGASVAGVRIYKNTTGKNGNIVFYLNGSQVYSTIIDLSYYNKYFGSSATSVQTSTVIKTGGAVNFSIGGYKKSFSSDAISAKKVTKITFTFEQYSSSPVFSYNGIFWAKFVKNNCEIYKDVPNKFSANDVVEADCKNGAIYLNGVNSPHLGALGNDWENFYLTPGLNQIGFAYSSWVADGCGPSVKVRYREVFL